MEPCRRLGITQKLLVFLEPERESQGGWGVWGGGGSGGVGGVGGGWGGGWGVVGGGGVVASTSRCLNRPSKKNAREIPSANQFVEKTEGDRGR